MLGTGDLSELALGWCTYGVGDQMSHYTVNSGVPKTLVQHLIRWVVDSEQLGPRGDEVGSLLTEIVEQEITPELVPTARGREGPGTESSIGPYALHDFTLFHVLGSGSTQQDRLPGPARVDGCVGRGSGPRTTRRTTGRRTTWRDPLLARGVHQALLRQPVQALRPAQRARRSVPAGPCRPAVTGGCPATPSPAGLARRAGERPPALGRTAPGRVGGEVLVHAGPRVALAAQHDGLALEHLVLGTLDQSHRCARRG